MSDISTTLLREAKEMRKDRPVLRKGQALFLVAHQRYPEIVEDIVGKALDPFHNCKVRMEFLGWLELEIEKRTAEVIE